MSAAWKRAYGYLFLLSLTAGFAGPIYADSRNASTDGSAVSVAHVGSTGTDTTSESRRRTPRRTDAETETARFAAVADAQREARAEAERAEAERAERAEAERAEAERAERARADRARDPVPRAAGPPPADRSPVPAPEGVPSPSRRATIAQFESLSDCETGDRRVVGSRRNVANPSGKYRGFFQFDLPTWNSVGMHGDPLDHTWKQQLTAAVNLHSARGWQPWPQCARYLGYL